VEPCCREVTRLVSASMDQRLPFGTRVRIGMHLAMCRFCSGFARQMRLLRQAVRERGEQLAADLNDAAMGLSDEARQRIKAALRDDLP
jgi:hypothetical protein